MLWAGFFLRRSGYGDSNQNERKSKQTDDSSRTTSPEYGFNVRDNANERYYNSKEEALNDLKSVYNRILEVSQIINISYSDLKTLTIEEFNALGEGYLKKLENDLNTQMKFSHELAALIGVAINIPKDFPKEPPKIELERQGQTEEEKEEIRLKKLKEVACRMWGQ